MDTLRKIDGNIKITYEIENPNSYLNKATSAR